MAGCEVPDGDKRADYQDEFAGWDADRVDFPPRITDVREATRNRVEGAYSRVVLGTASLPRGESPRFPVAEL